MKHIPIMLALALSISLTSYDGSTKISSDNINITQASSITMDITNSEVIKEVLPDKSEKKL